MYKQSGLFSPEGVLCLSVSKIGSITSSQTTEFSGAHCQLLESPYAKRQSHGRHSAVTNSVPMYFFSLSLNIIACIIEG